MPLLVEVLRMLLFCKGGRLVRASPENLDLSLKSALHAQQTNCTIVALISLTYHHTRLGLGGNVRLCAEIHCIQTGGCQARTVTDTYTKVCPVN